MSTRSFNKIETESEILRSICDYLSSQSVFFWRQNNVPVFARSNDGKMRFRALPKYTPRGLPDIMIVKQGILTGIEVKRPGALLRPEQAEICKAFQDNGANYYVVHSVKEMQNILRLL